MKKQYYRPPPTKNVGTQAVPKYVCPAEERGPTGFGEGGDDFFPGEVVGKLLEDEVEEETRIGFRSAAGGGSDGRQEGFEAGPLLGGEERRFHVGRFAGGHDGLVSGL